MRKQYDEFIKLKQKDMCKMISDMTYKFINPDTQMPTQVPAAHYEKELGRVTENYLSEATSRQILNVL